MNRDHVPTWNNTIDFESFPATTSNQITYECFRLMGGLENRRLYKRTDKHGAVTYHKIDTP